ncbi:hypothetical protein FM076_03900 [Streptomyces albus subsp. chlorinus]|uniref:DUF6011 domain-containing protein n=1 Tax=Streptomyces albus TaxID=1888 RepID=UPI0015714029|nr:DUF6011 domain-containing protein [Streptomyces albus]NSC20405.1 hypothetical protein [Streptomyces albus subsp. chlorinus]
MAGERTSAQGRPGAGAGGGGRDATEPAGAAVLPGSEPEEGGEDLPGRAARGRVVCRMCGQPLRDRASRLWGLGPDCRHKLAVRTAPVPPAHEVEQDTLPGL